MKTRSLLVAMCLGLTAFTLGCVEMDAPVTSDESGLDEGTEITLPPPVPGPPRPEPPVPGPPPPRTCVATCQQELQDCKLHATSPLEWCLCQAQHARCLGACGVLSPMPRCLPY